MLALLKPAPEPKMWAAALADPAKFLDLGQHHLCLAPQKSKVWVDLHSLFLTTSRFRKARFLDWWALRDQEALLEEYATGIGTPYENDAMRHGNKFEPKAREWYEEKTGLSVVECSMIVPKWDIRFGASPDGLVIDRNCRHGPFGLIEIKCPYKGMYEPLRERLQSGQRTQSTDFSHIKPEHYEQMQGAMAIFGRTWCHYVVYSTTDRLVYDELIPFDRTFWETELYPDLCRFWELVEDWKVRRSQAPAASPAKVDSEFMERLFAD